MITAQTIEAINEARTLSNISRRAETLFEDGYRAVDVTGKNQSFRVTSPKGDSYIVHTAPGEGPFAPSCSCPAFEKHDTCKHFQAIENEQRKDEAMVSEYEARFADAEDAEFGCATFARY